jgi:hypothetical protein
MRQAAWRLRGAVKLGRVKLGRVKPGRVKLQWLTALGVSSGAQDSVSETRSS